MAANAPAGNRWQQRNRGSFVPRSELSSEQQAILAAVPTFKRTWVRPSFLKAHQRPNYKICKWVIDTTPSTRMEFENDTTSERGGVQTTGASTVQNSTPTPIPTSAVIDLTGGATTPIPVPTPAPAPAPIVLIAPSAEEQHIPVPAPPTSTTTTTVILPPTTTLDPPVPSVPSASKPAQGTPPSEPTAHQQIIEAVKGVQGNEVQKIERAAVEDVEMKDGAGGGEHGPTKEFVEDGLQVANEATEGIM